MKKIIFLLAILLMVCVFTASSKAEIVNDPPGISIDNLIDNPVDLAVIDVSYEMVCIQENVLYTSSSGLYQALYDNEEINSVYTKSQFLGYGWEVVLLIKYMDLCDNSDILNFYPFQDRQNYNKNSFAFTYFKEPVTKHRL